MSRLFAFLDRSLETKFVLASAVSVAAVIGLLTAVGLEFAERRLDDDLRQTARVTAIAIADDIQLRQAVFDPRVVGATLHDFLTAAPSLRSISVYREGPRGSVLVVGTSTASSGRDSLVDRALARGDALGEDRAGGINAAVAPIRRGNQVMGAVLVTVSLSPVSQMQRQGRLFAAGFAAVSVLGIAGLVQVLSRRLVHAPLRAVVDTVEQARAGDLSVRAPVAREDEIGQVALGLNEMLAELEGLHASMQGRIDAATRELQARNDQIVRSYDGMLALREALARSQALATVGQTLADVAHQIGTPLNLASAHVQLLRQEPLDPAADRRLRIVEEQLERVTASVRDLLDRARPTSPTRAIDVGTMLERLADGLAVRAREGGVRVSVDAPAALPTVMADQNRLEMALMNLMTNAIDAMPDGGELRVRASDVGGSVRIEIQDTGVGIPEAIHDRIFEPWVTTKPPGQGTGLGLGITRDVVTQAGGTIGFDSRPGHGTTFVLTLPGHRDETPA
ncbi:MAG: HAMP domain-containing histidine kinase [Acidobacteria bacterium]|nr:HAMP domain-containing histidine kinase [Acidobacteriota bacterium]